MEMMLYQLGIIITKGNLPKRDFSEYLNLSRAWGGGGIAKTFVSLHSLIETAKICTQIGFPKFDNDEKDDDDICLVQSYIQSLSYLP